MDIFEEFFKSAEVTVVQKHKHEDISNVVHTNQWIDRSEGERVTVKTCQGCGEELSVTTEQVI